MPKKWAVVKMKNDRTFKPVSTSNKKENNKKRNWIANDYNDPYWDVPKIGEKLNLDASTARNKTKRVFFNKNIGDDNLLTDKINRNILSDLKKCYDYSISKEIISRPYRISTINNTIIQFLLGVNEIRNNNFLLPIVTLSQITEDDFLSYLKSFQFTEEQFFLVVDELNKLEKKPTESDWDIILNKFPLQKKTASIIKSRLKNSKLSNIYKSERGSLKEYDDANISRSVYELLSVNIKSVQNITSEIDILYKSRSEQTNPITFSPYKSLGGTEGICELFDKVQEDRKTSAIPVETAFHLISKSLSFQKKYSKSILIYIKEIDSHYKNKCSHLAQSTLLNNCFRRENFFKQITIPEELKELNITILGLEHEIKTFDGGNYYRKEMPLVIAIKLYIASMYILLSSFLATRSISIIFLKRNCFEQSPLDGLFDVIFKQAKSSRINSLEYIFRPIPEVIFDHGIDYAEFSQYLEQRYNIYNEDEDGYLFTSFHKNKNIITRHFEPNHEESLEPSHISNDFIIECLDLFSDWTESPLYEGKRWYPSRHQFRRIFAVLYFNFTDDCGLEELSWFLGHDSLEITFGYAEMNPSEEWMEEAIKSISERACCINDKIYADDDILELVTESKELSIKLNLQLEGIVYKAINERIKNTGEEVHFKKLVNNNIYFYFTNGD